MTMRLKDRWENFAASCLPADISSADREEVAKVFYAGATAAFKICTAPADGNGDASWPALDAELAEFWQNVR
jgi:hypothetical protein